MTATYDPADNKLRLYSDSRLPRQTYEQVRAAGFIWAAKQELFVAPAWTPEREDLLLELCGEIGDEDTSLVERAEERAERFEEYSEKRENEAERAHTAVEQLVDGIPLGQPILVGHHSERRARKDKEKIEAGLRKAVNLWRTSQYWEERARGALRHAKYKELPAVRYRRIKGLEADKRKQERVLADSEKSTKSWLAEGLELTPERALAIANYDHISRCFPLAEYPRESPASLYEGQMSLWSALEDQIITPDQARDIAVKAHAATAVRARRWLEHIENRLRYERAMLGEQGGIVANKSRPEVGGGCKCWASPRGGWSFVKKVNKVSVTVEDNWGNGGKNFTRTIPFDKLTALMSKEEVETKRATGELVVTEDGRGYFVSSATTVGKADEDEASPVGGNGIPAGEGLIGGIGSLPHFPTPLPEKNKFEVAAEALRNGVQTVSAPNLFPTPPDIARQLVGLADISDGMSVLEPSAGTGNLADAVMQHSKPGSLCLVELNSQLCALLASKGYSVVQGDFLEQNGDIGQFDRVVMNPPFDHGLDIKHVRHALTKLKPGGRLVSVMANGPRQREAFEPVATTWVDLPPDSFKQQGTSVNTAIVVLDASAA
jgi:phospholipid N-methyltransferase